MAFAERALSSSIPNVTVYLGRIRGQVGRATLHHSERQITFTLNKTSDRPEHQGHETFTIPFKHPLPPEDVLALYDSSAFLTADHFEPYARDPDKEDYDYQRLHCISIGDFWYLESAHDNVLITLQPHAGLRAIKVIYEAIDKDPDTQKEDKRYFRKRFSKVIRKAMQKDTSILTVNALLVNDCIEFHKQYRDSVWAQSMCRPKPSE